MKKIVLGRDLNKKLSQYKHLKRNFRVRESMNYAEIVNESGQKIIYNKNKKFMDGLFLFAMVNRDIKKYIEESGGVIPVKELPVNATNPKYKHKSAVGVDINNAYWSIACLKGYISYKTYSKGLEKDEYKVIRLSALSSLGKDKMYKVYEKGEYAHNEIDKGSNAHQDIYLDIRHTTYSIMDEIANTLGEDFYCWKTDCIFFHDTKENIELVMSSINDFGLESKVEKRIEIK